MHNAGYTTKRMTFVSFFVTTTENIHSRHAQTSKRGKVKRFSGEVSPPPILQTRHCLHRYKYQKAFPFYYIVETDGVNGYSGDVCIIHGNVTAVVVVAVTVIIVVNQFPKSALIQ
ncbi:Hypothetical predicted protein [Octopus vulgaris]|uniref:Uncharacterized protein n=1 Tax=Octopus vulgaris TaxID=6645 RepID=A0AA36F633_OCTVU|nr:Hypothetical predicted protein [Octopus vulgaris]